MISVTDALSFVKLTSDEERDLAKLEATIDGTLISQFTGAPLNMKFEQAIAPRVAYAIQRRYEEGGNWRVQVVPAPGACTFVFTPLYFSGGLPGKKSTTAGKKALPPLPKLAPIAGAAPGRRLLVRMPTRGRPAQALEVLQKYREMAGCPIAIEVVVDHNDETMLTCEVQQRLAALGCTVCVGYHRSKIEAVNSGRATDWDVLLLASDDMVPVVDGYAVRVLAAMEEHWPHLDGALYFDDGFQGPKLCTLPIMGRRLYEQFDECVYDPSYVSLFSDLEQSELLTAMGRLKYVDQKLIEHRHHIWGQAEKDALYKHNDSFESVDQATYEKRRWLKKQYAQFPFDAPPLWLSICIAALPARRAQLDRLVAELYEQIDRFCYSRRVEIVVDSRVGASIGEKRQALLERAKGHYVAFVDDDDWVAHDYVDRVCGAITRNAYHNPEIPLVDCVALNGVMTTSGVSPEAFTHSIRHDGWFTKDGVHYRTPNHLNAVKRELALKVGFINVSHGEDHDYSARLRPLLKTEGDAGAAPLYFYWYNPVKP